MPVRDSSVYQLTDVEGFVEKLYAYCRRYEVFSLLDSNDFYRHSGNEKGQFYHTYDFIAGIGAKDILKLDAGNAFQQLYDFHNNDWLFGYLGYDLKNEVEKLSSNNHDGLRFSDIFFFWPEHVITLKGAELTIYSSTPDAVYSDILISATAEEPRKHTVSLQARMSKDYYLETVQKIREHIEEGDVYELNFCQEYYNENAEVNPFQLFERLKHFSPQPFSAFLRNREQYIMSASMERFLKKEGDKLVSQPIKGTVRRSADPRGEEALKSDLLNNEKERAENVMIVDLVRNDLSRTAVAGTVKVEELFGIYTFPFVHHMISTVSSRMKSEFKWIDALKTTFPMGSMTGAPKVMAMELIEKYELTKRGVFSGAIGYITPEGDFDFNVVIRTFIYNELNKYLSLQVGSAITYDSVPEQEYDECQVKIQGLLKALE